MRQKCVWSVGFEPPLKAKGMLGVFQVDSLSTELSMLILSKIYSMCRLLLKINCSNVLTTLFINQSVVNLATRALVTYSIISIDGIYISFKILASVCS